MNSCHGTVWHTTSANLKWTGVCVCVCTCVSAVSVHGKTYHSVFCLFRPIGNILGFSRETLVAVITNIEGREWSRRINKLGKPEHPRASMSDDVECFFSMLRDTIGQNFIAKQVQFGFRKVALEFNKRLNPFYYHTSTHTRYSEGPLPSFSQVSLKQKRKGKRLPKREIPTVFVCKKSHPTSAWEFEHKGSVSQQTHTISTTTYRPHHCSFIS